MSENWICSWQWCFSKYTGRSLTRKTLRRSRIFLPLDPWSETTTHQRWQTDQMQHGELRTLRCPWSVDRLSKLSYTYISNIFIAGKRDSHGVSCSTRSESTSEKVQGNLSHGPAENQNKNKNDDDVDVQGNLSHDLPEWLQEELRHGLVDERCSRTPRHFQFFSWVTFRAASKSGIG